MFEQSELHMGVRFDKIYYSDLSNNLLGNKLPTSCCPSCLQERKIYFGELNILIPYFSFISFSIIAKISSSLDGSLTPP